MLLFRQLWPALQSVQESIQRLPIDHRGVCVPLGWSAGITRRHQRPCVLWNEGTWDERHRYGCRYVLWLYIMKLFSAVFFRFLKRFRWNIFPVVNRTPTWSELDGPSTTAALSLVSGQMSLLDTNFNLQHESVKRLTPIPRVSATCRWRAFLLWLRRNRKEIWEL